MSDLFGLLPLPATAPAEAAALTDPALDMLLAFVKGVLNYDLRTAWAARAPSDPLPVRYAFNHAPNLESFNMDEVPALYAWRSDDAGTFRYSQDLVADDAGVTMIWVPPALPQEDERFIHAVKNGIKKSLKVAFAQGRHPGWVLPGDTYYDPEDYGSVLLHHAKLGYARLGSFKQQTLLIESADKSFRKNYDALLFQVNTIEFFVPDLSLVAPLESMNGTISLALSGAREDALEVSEHVFDPTLTSIDVATGAAAGGTAVVITGTQLSEDGPSDVPLSVYFGTNPALAAAFDGTPETLAAALLAESIAKVDPDLLELVDETTLNIESPPGDAGLVSIRVVFPSGVAKTLIDAFTYT